MENIFPRIMGKFRGMKISEIEFILTICFARPVIWHSINKNHISFKTVAEVSLRESRLGHLVCWVDDVFMVIKRKWRTHKYVKMEMLSGCLRYHQDRKRLLILWSDSFINYSTWSFAWDLLRVFFILLHTQSMKSRYENVFIRSITAVLTKKLLFKVFKMFECL